MAKPRLDPPLNTMPPDDSEGGSGSANDAAGGDQNASTSRLGQIAWLTRSVSSSWAFQFALAYALLLRPGPRVYWISLSASALIVATWMVTRLIPPPRASAVEPVELWGVVATAAEVAATEQLQGRLGLRVVRVQQERPASRESRPRAA